MPGALAAGPYVSPRQVRDCPRWASRGPRRGVSAPPLLRLAGGEAAGARAGATLAQNQSRDDLGVHGYLFREGRSREDRLRAKVKHACGVLFGGNATASNFINN